MSVHIPRSVLRGKGIDSFNLSLSHTPHPWETNLWVNAPDNWREARVAGLEGSRLTF